MQAVMKKLQQSQTRPVFASHCEPYSPRRAEVEAFIAGVFARRHAAQVKAFAPNLVLLEDGRQLVAAAGWRAAQAESLFLERYLDDLIEQAMARLANQQVKREAIVEVGNLASEKAGGSVHVILALAEHLNRLGYEWVVFTATTELIGMFTRLGLPLLALAKADPARLGEEARDWGNYYETQPVIVAGRIRLGLDQLGLPSVRLQGGLS